MSRKKNSPSNAAKQSAHQAVTPELRKWIVDQVTAGCKPEAVLEAMVTAGWNEDVALKALESTLTDHVEQMQRDKLLPVAARVPDLALSDSPLMLNGGDRQVAVLGAMQLPRVVMLGSLLSTEECDALIAAAKPRMARSLTVQTDTGGQEVNDDRTSEGMFFERGENDIVRRIEARLAKLLDWPEENGEGLQILRYGPGAEYKPHYDYFSPDAPGTPTLIRAGGQRVATVVMYLNEPEAGGATTFPDAGFSVSPQRGNAVFFSYSRPHPSTKTLHGGAPVLRGEKWIATKWLRERTFAV